MACRRRAPRPCRSVRRAPFPRRVASSRPSAPYRGPVAQVAPCRYRPCWEGHRPRPGIRLPRRRTTHRRPRHRAVRRVLRMRHPCMHRRGCTLPRQTTRPFEDHKRPNTRDLTIPEASPARLRACTRRPKCRAMEHRAATINLAPSHHETRAGYRRAAYHRGPAASPNTRQGLRGRWKWTDGHPRICTDVARS